MAAKNIGYQSLKNVVTFNGTMEQFTTDELTSDVITVNSLLNINGLISSLPVDNSSIQYTSNQLSIKTNGVSGAMIQNNAISSNKIEDYAISSIKLGTGAVTTAKIDDLGITTAKLGTNSVTNDKIVSMSGSKIVGAISGNDLATYNLTIYGTNPVVNVSDNNLTILGTQFYNNGVAELTTTAIYSSDCVATNCNAENGNFDYINPFNYANVVINNGKIVSVGGSGALFDTSATTAERTLTIRDLSGTIALTSDIGTSFNDSSFELYDNGNNTRKAVFQCGSITAGNTRTFTFPDTTGTFLLENNVTNVSNKFFDDASCPFVYTLDQTAGFFFDCSGIPTETIHSITVPNASGTMCLTSNLSSYATLTGAENLTNKNLQDSTTTFYDNLDTTKKFAFQCSSISSATTRSITVPNASGVMLLDTAVQTLSNKTLTSPTISTIVNTGTLTLPTSTDTLVGRATTDTLTNKSLQDSTTYIVDNSDSTKKLQFQVSGITTGTTRTITVPDSSDTMTLNSASQTLSNKWFYTENNLFFPLRAVIRKATTQSINNTTYTNITSWTANDEDTSGSATLADYANNRLKLMKIGTWKITAIGSFASNSTGYRALSIRIGVAGAAASSAVDIYGGEMNSAAAVTGVCSFCVTTFYTNANTNDYVYLFAWQNSGGALNFGATAAENQTLLCAEFLHT